MNYNALLYKQETTGRNCDAHFLYEFFILRGDSILKTVKNQNLLIYLMVRNSIYNAHRLVKNYTT